jgi:hypothetical protein
MKFCKHSLVSKYECENVKEKKLIEVTSMAYRMHSVIPISSSGRFSFGHIFGRQYDGYLQVKHHQRFKMLDHSIGP